MTCKEETFSYIEVDGHWVKEGSIPAIDLATFDLLKQMTKEQKDMFYLGGLFRSGYNTNSILRAMRKGGAYALPLSVHPSDVVEVNHVLKVLDKYGFKNDLEEWKLK